MRRWLALTICLCWLLPASAEVASPQPGEVYREFTLVMTNSSQDWRVTDPNAGAPGAQDELPNPVMNLSIPGGQLAGAIRAELLIDYWGGHPGTIDARFRFNSNAWLSLPQLTTTPPPATGNNRPECFMQQWNPVVSVPVAHLQEGANSLEGTSGGQTCYSFNWGQWGWYGVKLRVYFDPVQVSAPTGQVISPVDGATIGENPTVEVSASGGGGIERVDFLAYADAYDWDGDGDFLDWGQAYHRGKPVADLPLSHHVGTDTSSPFALTFDTNLIPDQAPGSVKFGARIKGANGLWYVTPTVADITLARTGTVLLAKPQDVPSRFWVRSTRPSLSSKVTIPAGVDLTDVSSAKLLVRTWNGVDGSGPGNHATKVNGWTIPVTYGENHHYAADTLDVNTSVLVNGENTITFSTTSIHHGIEILWPGPALLLRTGSAVVGVCGDGTLDAGEQCDDGNTVGGDGCEADCTESLNQSVLPALYPFSGSGTTVADASTNGNDGVLENGAQRDAAGRFGAALRFDGNAGNVNLGPLDVTGLAGTWAAFFKADDFGISDARMLSKATSVFEPDHYFMLSTVAVSGSNHLRFRLKTGGVTRTVFGTLGTISPGDWFHAAATYDGVEIRLYQDGVLVGSAAAGGSINGNPGVEVWIGDHVGGGKSFDGLIDEVLIDDRTYSEQEIAALTTGTVEPPSVCGNGIVESGEECDDGNMDAGDGCQPDCELPICGDGFVDPGEECDDGNTTDGDGCQGGCLAPVCGDSVVDAGEECDDGNTTDGDGCQGGCLLPICGDGIVDPDEECDDGNTDYGDGCQGNCLNPVCGDGWLDPGEECDDGNQVDGDGCPSTCQPVPCGDGLVGPGEECDDGNQINGDGCQANCLLPVCGDGITDPDEVCDDANAVDNDACGNDCLANVCGDAEVNAGERCDDGNGLDGDGCDTNCLISVVLIAIQDPADRNEVRLEWNGAPVPYEVFRSTDATTLFDPANTLGSTASSSWLDTPPGGIGVLYFYRLRSLCGNGSVDTGEECDDGNNRDGDGCRADCMNPD